MKLRDIKVMEDDNGLERGYIAAADDIVANCGPWLSQWQDGTRLLYRAMNLKQAIPPNASHFNLNIRSDRIPSATPHYLHNFVVEKIIEEAKSRGVPSPENVANRHNSAFCFMDSPNEFYGRPFVCFPVGKYRSTYIEGVRDFFADIIVTDTFSQMGSQSSESRLKIFRDNWTKIKDDLVFDDLSGVEGTIEVMVKAPSAIYVRYDKIGNIIPLIKERMQ